MSIKNKVNCQDCQHFFITWQAGHPYGCKSMQFQSKNVPCIDVLAQEGVPCMAFRSKRTLENQEIYPIYAKEGANNDEILDVTI